MEKYNEKIQLSAAEIEPKLKLEPKLKSWYWENKKKRYMWQDSYHNISKIVLG